MNLFQMLTIFLILGGILSLIPIIGNAIIRSRVHKSLKIWSSIVKLVGERSPSGDNCSAIESTRALVEFNEYQLLARFDFLVEGECLFLRHSALVPPIPVKSLSFPAGKWLALELGSCALHSGAELQFVDGNLFGYEYQIKGRGLVIKSNFSLPQVQYSESARDLPNRSMHSDGAATRHRR